MSAHSYTTSRDSTKGRTRRPDRYPRRRDRLGEAEAEGGVVSLKAGGSSAFHPSRLECPLMTPPQAAAKKTGLVARVARWCVQHRRRALIAWVLLLVAVLGRVGRGRHPPGQPVLAEGNGVAAGGGCAQARLSRPSRATWTRSSFTRARAAITDPAIRARIAPAARPGRAPAARGRRHQPVRRRRRRAISRDGRIAFATVTFDEQAPALSKPTVERVISAAEQARAPDLQVELGGQAIEQTQTTSFGGASARRARAPRSSCC